MNHGSLITLWICVKGSLATKVVDGNETKNRANGKSHIKSTLAIEASAKARKINPINRPKIFNLIFTSFCPV
jgi:hypothetical protein